MSSEYLIGQPNDFTPDILWLKGFVKALAERIDKLEQQQKGPERDVTKFHSGLYILRLENHEEKFCATDPGKPTKQVEFTIPEGYVVKEIVLKEKR